ncbi:hypothetical protein MmiHf6_12210 [Methanimicrococcus hongohii]|uniref:Uncharacterized protein n=1 Tax=Methanimicrococcus hongohii TaxID=3028295 RepID=A0AA96V2H7_9EURY|nr:DUF2927 domain-containing protein [Methanimicrococcus sp. Hf6]WNY23898.1 hypothetical protein MmiHf6_12210 [Methanimicrococcus sp. Hf6]
MNNIHYIEKPKGIHTIQKKSFFNKTFLLFGVVITVVGLICIVGLQTNTDHFKPDSTFHFLNDSEDVIDFSYGLNFIYETQLSRVRTIEKWSSPIKIKYEGNPTKEDIAVLKRIIKEFNTINGLPEMKIVNKDENVLLVYTPKESLPTIQEKYNLSEIDKGICRRRSENGEIISAVLVIESDISQEYKNSVVLHEFFHLVGFYEHSFDKTSVINRDGEAVPKLSAVDTLSFKMLYHPEITIGMTYEEISTYYQNKDMNEILK